MLLKNKSLKKLYLVSIFIGEEGVLKLIDCMSHNTTIEKLVLSKTLFASGRSRVDRRVIGFYSRLYAIGAILRRAHVPP